MVTMKNERDPNKMNIVNWHCPVAQSRLWIAYNRFWWKKQDPGRIIPPSQAYCQITGNGNPGDCGKCQLRILRSTTRPIDSDRKVS